MDTPGATSPPDSGSGSGRDWPPGWHVEVVDETGSTNADLLAATATGAPDRSVLAARHQTAGRGRLDRRWEAPAGANLLVSLLLRRVPAHPHELTQRVALAAQRACRAVAGVESVLKWPNDLLVDDRKLAGVLAQAGGGPAGAPGHVVGHVPGHVVVGIGLNVGWAPQGAVRLGEGIDPLDVLCALLTAYDALPDEVYPEYRRQLGTLGRSVRVELAGAHGDTIELEGRAVDVEADGRLVVLDACGVTHRIDTGDVVHLR